MLTRSQFDEACKELITKYSDYRLESPATNALKGWSWNEHPSAPNFGFMSRTRIHTWRPDSSPNEEDLGELDLSDDIAVSYTPSTYGDIISQQYIVYSATFRVPTFYFVVHDSTGAPFTLANILKTSLFKRYAFEGTNSTTFGLTQSTSSFPLLSQGDHPTLGTPCWYLHPCETLQAVEEVMAKIDENGRTKELRLVRWLEVWLMIVGTAVNFTP